MRLFTLPGAALTLNGSTAQLCGTPQDWEELLSFLQFEMCIRDSCWPV